MSRISSKANPAIWDVAIVGGGSAGYAAARTAAKEGLKTVVIEGGDEVGGLCILRGCMPSKALLYAAEVLHLARTAGTWGFPSPKLVSIFPQSWPGRKRWSTISRISAWGIGFWKI